MGVLPRWRFVREAEVLSAFLSEQPVEVSQDYLGHTAVRTLGC
jgi:hypothetical protein